MCVLYGYIPQLPIEQKIKQYSYLNLCILISYHNLNTIMLLIKVIDTSHNFMIRNNLIHKKQEF